MTLDNITSVKELNEKGLYLFVDDKILIENKIHSIIKMKGYKLADISRMTGISKQNISNLLTTNIPPNIEYVLKIAYVLDVSVESLYEYNKKEWFIPYNQEESLSYYYDMYKNQLILNEQRKKQIDENGFVYLKKESNERIDENEASELLKEYTSFEVVRKLAVELMEKDDTLSLSQAKKIVKEKQLILYKKSIIPIYQKVYKKITPKKVKKLKK